MNTRILLADDHAILRQGLKRILEGYPEFEVVAEAATGLEAVHEAERTRPDVAVLDVAMKELNGIEAAAQLQRTSPHTAVLILSMHKDESYVHRAARAGAAGYLLKDTVEDELVQAINEVRAGGHYFSPVIADLVRDSRARTASGDQADDRYELLSKTERIVYQMIAEGNSNKEIGGRLSISVHTVETHRAHIMAKMGLHSVTELVLGAVRRGLVV